MVSPAPRCIVPWPSKQDTISADSEGPPLCSAAPTGSRYAPLTRLVALCRSSVLRSDHPVAFHHIPAFPGAHGWERPPRGWPPREDLSQESSGFGKPALSSDTEVGCRAGMGRGVLSAEAALGSQKSTEAPLAEGPRTGALGPQESPLAVPASLGCRQSRPPARALSVGICCCRLGLSMHKTPSKEYREENYRETAQELCKIGKMSVLPVAERVGPSPRP